MRTARKLWVALSLVAVPLGAQDIDFTSFHTPAEVSSEMSRLLTRFPTLVTLVPVGTSVEGRTVTAIKISDHVATDEPDEADVIFVAMHHAREWITVELALYLAEYLLKNYATDPDLRADIDELEIWIVPVVNPDGYQYSAATPANRYWRKNRRPNGDGTYGVDLNRNWGYEWGHDSGSSSMTVSDIYRGPWAFSEPEVVAIRDLVNSVDNLEAFVTYHSFSELILTPWIYAMANAPGEPILERHQDRAIARTAAVHGVTYGTTLGYLASGEATDYLWGETRTVAITPELRPSPTGIGGFAPPASEIIPNAEENLPMALALIHDAAGREVWIRDHPSDTGQEPSAVWTGSGWSQPFWESPDIWTSPEVLDQGATVDLNVRVHNATGSPLHDVEVRAYFTDPRITLEFPSPSATLIGTQTVTVPPGGRTVRFSWTVPVGTNSWGERHWCVGAVLMHEDDMPLTTEARRTSNIAIRNFNTSEVVEAGTLMFAATNYLDVAAELRVHVDQESLPDGWYVVVSEARDPDRQVTPALARKGRLLNAEGILLEAGETIMLPMRVRPPATSAGDTVDIRVHGTLLPLVPGERVPVGNGYTYRVITAQPGPGAQR